MNKVYISVIIPTRNRPQQLLRCLASLGNQEFCEPYEIIVVDDGSEDNRVSEYQKVIAQTGFKNIKYFVKAAYGPGVARNFGGVNAEGYILAFIDDDCMAAPDWLSSISRTFRGDNSLSMLGGPLILQFSESSPWKILNEYFDLNSRRQKSHYFSKYEFRPFNTLITANMAVKKDDFYKKGGFLREYSYLGDDTGLFYVFLKGRKKIYFNPEIRVFHLYTEKFLDLLTRKCYRYGKVDVMMYHDFFRRNFMLDLRPLHLFASRIGNLSLPNTLFTVYVGVDYIKLLISILIFSLFYPYPIYFTFLIVFILVLVLSLSGKRYILALCFFKAAAGLFVLLGRLRYCLKYRIVCI